VSIPLFWRLFIPNAAVLLAACVVLFIEPANGRVVALAGGLAIMLTVNLVLMRRAFAPLARLLSLIPAIDPLEPGRRLPALRPESELTQLAHVFNEMLDRLETERRESGRRALAAQEQERRRVSAELHDEIGQQLTALVLQLDRLSRRAPEALGREIAETTAAAKATLEEVRELAHRLRPEVLDQLGLVPALRNLCDRFTAGTGLVVHRTLPETLPRLSEDDELVIYRVAQESLTNVVRHAAAGSAHLALETEPGAVSLRVADDGAGPSNGAALRGTGGVRGMRERALSVGGRLDVRRAEGGGTEVRLRIPIGGDGG